MFLRPRAGFALVLVSLGAAACGSSGDSGLQSVRDSGDPPSMFFQVPSDWTVYQSTDLEGVTETPFVTQTSDLTLPVASRVVFQGTSRDAGIPDANVSDSQYPVGSAVVRTIPASQRDAISRYWLAELVVPYHAQAVASEELKQDISLGEGFDGVQLLVAYNDSTTGIDTAVFFISVTDPEVEEMYSIAVGCSVACFNENVDAIVDIVDSWLVNTR
ncbi:MAG: hypothetical protein HZA58_03350 [Acidimicrobiia bacterium]|nr:hypothetical protein [Acidimicrobiia bacterium]